MASSDRCNQTLRGRVLETLAYERPVVFRLPFRFGSVTIREVPLLLVRVRVKIEGGREAWGAAAELAVPKWFDKRPELSHQDNVEQLRQSLRLAAGLYRGLETSLSPFEIFSQVYAEQYRRGAAQGLNRLVAGYGPALMDRAVLDACCRATETRFYDAVRYNLMGMVPEVLLHEFQGFNIDAFLAGLKPTQRLWVRHTVGLLDPLSEADLPASERINDGLPETLQDVIRTYAPRFFKLKLGGCVEEDLNRMEQVARLLESCGGLLGVTLDGNEQYGDLDRLREFWRKMQEGPSLRHLVRSILWIEQPLDRNSTLRFDVSELSQSVPLIIDESDDGLEAFAISRLRGYRGVSSKTCKGIYKALLNAARCHRWNEETKSEVYFLSGEDLTHQPGPGLQQDLALAAILGLKHVERNGHFYVRGLENASGGRLEALLQNHGDLYEQVGEVIRLRISDGAVDIGSLETLGFASAVDPDWESLESWEL